MQHNRSVYRDMAGMSGKVVSSSSGAKREDVFFYDDKQKKKYRMGRFLGKVFCRPFLKMHLNFCCYKNMFKLYREASPNATN